MYAVVPIAVWPVDKAKAYSRKRFTPFLTPVPVRRWTTWTAITPSSAGRAAPYTSSSCALSWASPERQSAGSPPFTT